MEILEKSTKETKENNENSEKASQNGGDVDSFE